MTLWVYINAITKFDLRILSKYANREKYTNIIMGTKLLELSSIQVITWICLSFLKENTLSSGVCNHSWSHKIMLKIDKNKNLPNLQSKKNRWTLVGKRCGLFSTLYANLRTRIQNHCAFSKKLPDSIFFHDFNSLFFVAICRRDL